MKLESRLAISEGRKKYLKENPDKHPWKKNRGKSVPCENVKKFLSSEGMNFVEEFSPLEDRNFSIDIAFPDIKFGIEVNGNQHYNRDGTLKSYYQERHDLIKSAGWELLELHYSLCFNDEVLAQIITLRHHADYSEFILRKLNKKKKIGLPAGQKLKNATDAKWEPFKQKVLNSGIDFSKFGWVGQVATMLGIRTQHVSKWMRRYLNDFYEQHCFKRK